jgi:hypothetical protein
MATPTVTVTEDTTIPYRPGQQIVLSWTVVDEDNSFATIRYEGRDSQNNVVSGEITIDRQDVFTMTLVEWVDEPNGTPFNVNNTTRTATGTVPSA